MTSLAYMLHVWCLISSSSLKPVDAGNKQTHTKFSLEDYTLSSTRRNQPDDFFGNYQISFDTHPSEASRCPIPKSRKKHHNKNQSSQQSPPLKLELILRFRMMAAGPSVFVLLSSSLPAILPPDWRETLLSLLGWSRVRPKHIAEMFRNPCSIAVHWARRVDGLHFSRIQWQTNVLKRNQSLRKVKKQWWSEHFTTVSTCVLKDAVCHYIPQLPRGNQSCKNKW
jgi:hypothetical protein